MFGNIILTVFFFFLDREDSTKESDFALDDDADEDEEGNDWDGEVEWAEEEAEVGAEGDVPDESAAYIDFLNEEVRQDNNYLHLKREVLTDEPGSEVRIFRG